MITTRASNEEYNVMFSNAIANKPVVAFITTTWYVGPLLMLSPLCPPFLPCP